MKKIYLMIFVILIINGAFSQVAYYGAVKINNQLIIRSGDTFIFNPDSVHSLSAILKAYVPDKNKNDTIITDGMVLTKFKNNPFIGKQVETLVNSGAGADKSGLRTNPLASLGSLDVTNFADGLAKFLVERVKQELSTTFFERFKNDLDSNKQLQIIFPSTFFALKSIGNEIYNYSAYIDLLRESFQKDLALLLPNIGKLVNDKSMNELFFKFPEVRIMLSDGLFIVNELGAGKFPGEVFHDYLVHQANKDSLNKVNPYLYPSLQTLDLFSQSLRSQQTGHYWVSYDSLKLVFDKITFQIYMGLIYQQASNASIKFSDKITLTSKMKEYAEKIDTLKILYEPFLTGIIDRGKSVEYAFNAVKKTQKTGTEKPTYQDYFSLYDASLNFLEYLSQSPFLDTLLSKTEIDKLSLVDYFRSVRSLGNIYIDIYEKQYPSAIVEFTGIFQTLLSDKIDRQIKLNENIIKSATDAEKKALKQINIKLEKTLKANDLILKYGSLAASIARAETSDDVKNAIEAAALPAGSSRIKRETPFNVSLNAYTGLFTGYEKITEVDNEFMINSYGLAAPVGVALSWGTHKFLGMPCKKPDGHWSYSLFVSFIDIGTIASFRFQNDTVAQVPTIQLQDIFSPGLFFSAGIPKCPLSVNIGAQVGPNLRKIYSTGESETGEMVYQNQYENNVYWRFSISLVVDIPIVNFCTKSR